MNKLLKLIAAPALLTTSALHGQIVINDNLSVTGFLDMSATYSDQGEDEASSYDLDQMEIDFIYSFDQITAQVDIDYQRDDINELDLEQAFITYDFGSGTSLSAGKFLSYHGWETAEPTGLYQYSYAYGDTIPGYHNGVSLDHAADWGSIGVAILDSVYDDDGSLGNANDDFEMGLETKLVLTPAEGLTLYLGYGLDRADTGSWTPIDDRELLNFWSSYEFGINTVAVEYNDYTQGDFDIDQWLVMWSAAVSDTGTFTARVSKDDRSLGGVDISEMTKYTAAYIHTVTDNLAIITEISRSDFEADDNLTELAVEALFTF